MPSVLLLLTCLGLAPAPPCRVAWFTDADIAGAVRLAAPAEMPGALEGTAGVGFRPTEPFSLEGTQPNRAEGVVSFWLRPEWRGDDGRSHRLLRLGDPAMNGMLVEKSERGMLRFVIASPTGVTVARTDVSSWRPGEWHHVAAGWFSRGGQPLGLSLWVDRVAVDGPTVGTNSFADPEAMADPRLVLGDTTSEATFDELILRDDPDSEPGGQIGTVWRDWFRTAPCERIAIEPESSFVASEPRVLLGHAKQFGLRAGTARLEPVTDFTVRYGCWGDFDAKPFIKWSSSDLEVATVDAAGLVTGIRQGRCTLTAEYRGLRDSFALEVVAPEGPDLDLVTVSRLPRYDGRAAQWVPEPGERVEWQARIINMGFATAPAGAIVRFELLPDADRDFVLDPDERPIETATRVIDRALEPREEATIAFPVRWTDEPLWVRVSVDPDDAIPEFCEANNVQTDLSTARPLRFGYTPEFLESCWQERKVNLVGSFSYYDYINANKRRAEMMLREAVYPETSPIGVADSFRTDLIYPLPPEGEPDPPEAAPELYDGGFPVGSHAELMATDSGLIHEFGHTYMQLPDLYGYGVLASNVLLTDREGVRYAGGPLLPTVQGEMLSFSPANNVPCGVGYTPLMDYCHLWLDPAAAGQVHHFRGYRGDRFWGVQGWMVPAWENMLAVTDRDDRPLAGARVSVYHVSQIVEIQDATEKYFADRPKFEGMTDDEGRWLFPKTTSPAWDDPDTDEVEGERPAWNPFQTVHNEVAFTPNVWEVQGLLLIKIEAAGGTEFSWLPLTEFNRAFCRGEIRGVYPIRTSLPSGGLAGDFAPTEAPEALRERNLRPVAVCAGEVTVRCGEEYRLDGSASYDPEGQPLAHRWKRRSWGVPGPERGTEAVFTAKAPDKPGEVLLRYYVIDGLRVSEMVDVTVRVVE